MADEISVEFVPNAQGLIDVMRSPGVEKLVGLHAARIADSATRMASAEPMGYTGKNTAFYGSHTKIQRLAAKGYAYTGNAPAMYDNAANDTLHHAI